MEAIDVQRPGLGLELALVTPVDLGLGASQDPETAVQANRVACGSDQPLPVLPHIDLHPLVVAGEAMLGDQPLMDH
jgi:hypothetical protein